MLEPKTTKDYAKKLSEKYGIPRIIIQKLITYGMKNICQMIKKGEDIQLQHFGSIYFNKSAYKNFLISKTKQNGKNNNGPGTVRKGKKLFFEKLTSKIHINPKPRKEDPSV